MRFVIAHKLGRLFVSVALSVPGIVAADDFSPESGQTQSLPCSAFPRDLQLWLPRNYNPKSSETWPVLLYYHGTNGSPTVNQMRHFTGGNDWIIVGMTYQKKGQLEYSEKAIQGEISAYHALLRELENKSIRIDRKRVFMSGFSKGGWVSGIFLEKDPSLAGGLVLGAGIFHRGSEPIPPPFSEKKPIYIGIGDQDGNFAMSFAARDHFASLNSDVLLDIWFDCGHAFPRDEDAGEMLRQWLLVHSAQRSNTEMQEEAIAWFERQLARIENPKEETPLQERYRQLRQLADSPFADWIDSELRSIAAEIFQELSAQPEITREREAEKSFREILKRESADRFLRTLIQCQGEYAALAASHSDTFYGALALKASDRASEMIERAKQAQ